MSGSTKMILITSNEDLIQQLQFNSNSNIQVIDLDRQPFDGQNGNLLQQLSGNNLSKRSLDPSDRPSAKATKTTRKSAELICTICGNRAIGFNYDVLTCASCKAFFRRNAFQDLSAIRCLKGDGHCSVALDVRRKCQRCRLERCLAVGMRKDFILSEEEKQRRKQRLEENRDETARRRFSPPSISPISNEIDQLLMDIDDHLSEDRAIIRDVQLSFTRAFDLFANVQCTDRVDLSDRLSALISWSEFVSELTLRFISFFRQIKEFEQLDADDRFILIKYNLSVLFPIGKCFSYRETHECCSHDCSEEAEKHRQFYHLCGIPSHCRNAFIDLIVSLVRLTKQDPKILSLLLTVLIFSPCLSMNDNEPPLKDPLTVHQAQSYYTRLLWNYLVNEWGEEQTERSFVQLMALVLKIQTNSKSFRELFRDQYQSLNSIEKIAPIMQSVLHIS